MENISISESAGCLKTTTNSTSDTVWSSEVTNVEGKEKPPRGKQEFQSQAYG